MVEDPAVVRTGDRPELEAAVLDFQRLDLLGAVGGKAILQIDAGERGRKLAQIGCRRADQAGELAETPMRRRDGRVSTGQHQRQPLGIVAARLDADGLAFDDPGLAAFGPPLHRIVEVGERQDSARRPAG